MCTRAYIYAHTLVFAFVYTQKRKRSFLRAFACVRLRACLCADLIKTQNVFARKIFPKSTLGSETFRMYYTPNLYLTPNVSYTYMYVRIYISDFSYTYLNNLLSHTPNLSYTQSLIHTISHTHNLSYTQSLIHTISHTHNLSYTQSLIHTISHTHNLSNTQSVICPISYTPSAIRQCSHMLGFQYTGSTPLADWRPP